MAVSFPNLSQWLWRKLVPAEPPSPSSASTSTTASRDPDDVQYPARKQTSFRKSRNTNPPSTSVQTSRRPAGRRRWQSRSERQRFDREFDMVLVPSDGGGCISGSDSDDSDWSVGWFEPHAPEFLSDDDSENSFAVLVPCYGSPIPEPLAGRGSCCLQDGNQTSQLWAAVLSNLSNGSKTDGKRYLEQWLSSLQG